jgi:hypothetical protein
MEEVDFNGVMVKFMMDNGWMIKNMEVVSGKPVIRYRMQANGNIIKFKDLEF